MNKSNYFQITLIALSLFIAGAAVVVFALQKAQDSAPPPRLTVWGYMNPEDFEEITDPLTRTNPPLFEFNYQQVYPDSVDTTLVQTLAYGNVPDLLIYPQEVLFRNRSNLLFIPYTSYSERTFRDTFAQAGEVFTTPGGILAFPLMIDPLVMYWNRTLLSSAGYAKPPVYWDELPVFITKTLNKNGVNITTASIGIGTFDNIKHAKNIFSTMLLQAGNSILEWQEGRITPVFAPLRSQNAQTVQSIVRFFTEFADPVKSVYTWNTALPQDRTMFVSGDLALYLGSASEAEFIQKSNPNLNFDVALVPQIRNNPNITNGQVIGISVPTRSSQAQTAVQVALILTNAEFGQLFADTLGYAPARRDLLSATQPGAFSEAAYTSALISRSWPDINPRGTYEVFKGLVQTVTSGRSRISDAVDDAQTTLESIIQ